MSHANFKSWKDSGGTTVFTMDDHNGSLRARGTGRGTGRAGYHREM
jgi:hypothetical protein